MKKDRIISKEHEIKPGQWHRVEVLCKVEDTCEKYRERQQIRPESSEDTKENGSEVVEERDTVLMVSGCRCTIKQFATLDTMQRTRFVHFAYITSSPFLVLHRSLIHHDTET